MEVAGLRSPINAPAAATPPKAKHLERSFDGARVPQLRFAPGKPLTRTEACHPSGSFLLLTFPPKQISGQHTTTATDLSERSVFSLCHLTSLQPHEPPSSPGRSSRRPPPPSLPNNAILGVRLSAIGRSQCRAHSGSPLLSRNTQ